MLQKAANERWARFGPRSVSWLRHIPRAGLCLSTFVIARRGNSILLGRPLASAAWPEKGGFPKHQAEQLEKEGTWLLPATHLLMDETPDDSARRIACEWAGLSGKTRFVTVQSHLRLRKPGQMGYTMLRKKLNHWDICFIYEMRTKALPKAKPWWSEMRFFSTREILKITLGRGHIDILKEAGYL